MHIWRDLRLKVLLLRAPGAETPIPIPRCWYWRREAYSSFNSDANRSNSARNSKSAFSSPQNWGQALSPGGRVQKLGAGAIAWGQSTKFGGRRYRMGAEYKNWEIRYCRRVQLEEDSQTTTHTPELGSAFQRRGRALAKLPNPSLKNLNLTPKAAGGEVPNPTSLPILTPPPPTPNLCINDIFGRSRFVSY